VECRLTEGHSASSAAGESEEETLVGSFTKLLASSNLLSLVSKSAKAAHFCLAFFSFRKALESVTLCMLLILTVKCECRYPMKMKSIQMWWPIQEDEGGKITLVFPAQGRLQKQLNLCKVR
jgi:hypothetical protein